MNTKSACLTVAVLSLFVVALMGLSFDGAQAESIRDSISGELDFRAYYNDIGGNESLSFMTEGPGVLTDLYFYYDDKSGVNDQIKWSGEAYIQATDDPQYKIRNDEVRLQNIYLTAQKSDAWKFTGGYYSERYTQYTMNSVLLGANGWMQVSDGVRLRAFAGRANRARPQNKHRRYAGGARLEYTPAEDHMFGLTYVKTDDDEDGLDGNETTGVDTFTNSVTSLNYEGEFTEQNLKLEGEFAQSDFDSQPLGGESSDDNENARKFQARWKPTEITELKGKYEKVDPDFETLSGFATTDRELWRLNWNQVVTEEINFKSTYEEWEDGLEGNTENDVRLWEIDARYTPESNEDAYWKKELAVRYEDRENEGDTSGLGNDIANESDESLWDIELWNRVGKSEIVLGYQRDEDAIESDSSVRHEWTLDYNRTFEWFGVTEGMSLDIPVDYSLNTKYKEDVDENAAGSGNDAVDRTVRVDNQFIVAPGQKEEIELYHGYLNEHSDNSSEIKTRSWGIAYNHTLNRELGSKLSLSFDYTDNTDKGSSTNDYREEKVQFRYTTPF